MRTTVILLFILMYLQNNLMAQIQHSLGMPEYYTLYSGYDNRIIIASNNGKVINPVCPDAEIKEDKYNYYVDFDTVTESRETNCFIVKPFGSNANIVVKFDVIDEKGKLLGQDSALFYVRRFPNPVVKVNTISKSMGQTITVGLPGDSPLKSPAYSVRSVELLLGDNNPTFESNIPGSAVANLKVGKMIGVSVVVFNPYTNNVDVISGALSITE